MGLHDFTLYDLIARNAVCYRNRPAWYEADADRTLTFLQVKEMVDALAGSLQAIGIKKGDRIGVLGKNSLEYFLLYGAAAALGAILLPVNWRLSAGEIEYILKDCEPEALFVDTEYQDLAQSIKDRIPFIKQHYNLYPDRGNFQSFASVTNTPGNFEATDVSAVDSLVIIHTAAMEGKPRGAILSHANLLCACLHLNHCFHLNENDVHLNLLPLFHVGGLFMALGSYMAGALNINMRKFDAAQSIELIETKKVTLFFEFSPILAAIIDQHEKTGRDIKSVRAVMGLDTPETIEKYQCITGGTFYAVYGQTETTGLATVGRYNDRPGSAGKVIPLAEIRLLDDYDHPVPIGQIGEITMKGPQVFRGYWNMPEDTALTFREGRHHTGDLGRFDEDGFLWYEGRKAEKELIKPGGENVYPIEVEKAILEHPNIEKVVVFGVPDPKWKEGIKAVCRLKSGTQLEAKELIRFVGKRIAGYKKPQYVEFISDFPSLEDGAPDRAKIKELYGGTAKV